MPDYAEVFTEGELGNETHTVVGRNGSPIDKIVLPPTADQQPHERFVADQEALQHACRTANSAATCSAFLVGGQVHCPAACGTLSSERDQYYANKAKNLVVTMAAGNAEPIDVSPSVPIQPFRTTL